MACERGSGLSPLADLTLSTTPSGQSIAVRKVSWSETATPRRINGAGSPKMTVNYSAKSNLLRRLHSAPSPTVLTVSEPTGKENAFTVTRSPGKSCKPLDDQDVNSQDSACVADDMSFISPTSLPLRCSGSFNKTWCSQDQSPLSSKRSFSMFSSQSHKSLSFSSDSYDDGLADLSDLEKSDENSSVLGKLLTGALIATKEKTDSCTPVSRPPPLRRAFSMVENKLDEGNRVIDSKLDFKRPCELGIVGKRRKFGSLHEAPSRKLRRSISETVTTMHSSTLSNCFGRTDLIADFSRPFALPVIKGYHSELATISSETLCALLRGEFSNTIRSFTIIDCRYPYEFDGGHIRGAINLYNSELLEDAFIQGPAPPPTGELGNPDGHDILVFHCEFSRLRGPNLYKWLRRADRNNSTYPNLIYPEMYLLEGGYNTFYSFNKSLCEPNGYRSMIDPRFAVDLRKFSDAYGSVSGSRTNLKRIVKF